MGIPPNRGRYLLHAQSNLLLVCVCGCCVGGTAQHCFASITCPEPPLPSTEMSSNQFAASAFMHSSRSGVASMAGVGVFIDEESQGGVEGASLDGEGDGNPSSVGDRGP